MRAPGKSTAQRALLGAALSVAAPFAGAVEPPTQQITRAGTQSSVTGPAATFVGKVRVDGRQGIITYRAKSCLSD